MRSPPKKPAEPFGTINFGKDGSVTRNIQKLSHVKNEQELSVGQRFAAQLEGVGRTASFLRQLPEYDHDFALVVDSHQVVVQAAEVTDRFFLRPLRETEYVEGKTGFKHFQKGAGEQYFGIDTDARDDAIASVLRGKLAKYYARPADDPLWLLLWSTGSLGGGVFFKDGTLWTSEPFTRAARLLVEGGSGPFAEVWYSDLRFTPLRIDESILKLPVETETGKWSVALTPMSGQIVRRS